MINGIITALLVVLFIGGCFWAYSPRRKKDFEEAANLPLEDTEESTQ